MSNMIFLCQGWIYKMYHTSNMIFLCQWWIYGKYAISNIILLCPGWIYEIFTIWIYTCLCLCPTWVSYVKDESTKWLRYVILHLLNHMSNMIFLCPGWIYEMFTIWIYTCLWLCPTWVSYVWKYLSAFANSYVQQIFLCPGKLYASTLGWKDKLI